MSEDIYVRLRSFLDALPGGFPATDSGVEIKILKKLYTPEQAELTLKLKNEPEEISSIAGRVGMTEAEAAAMLEEMAQNGVIYRVRRDGRALYQAFQFLVGIYEFQLKNLDLEFSELFEAYLPYFGMSMASVKTGQLRRIPVGSVIETKTAVAPYNNVRELIKGKDFIAVQQCICRKEQGLLGHPCDFPGETCLGFGDFARFYVDNGMGRQIDHAEVLRILDMAEEKGLVVSPTNAQNIDFICLCCSCCCPGLRFGKMMERPGDSMDTAYVSTIDSELCTACGTCVDRCPMDAIKLDDVAEIIDGRCIGCGVCIPTCPVEAISLEDKPGKEAPP
ncbi:MAG: 4Fe-4S binding protein, partial [Proteobacteria bacterium]|nr:4Fe-4S binding protein [Pseudomonadota bacterium]